ncbi:MAG: acetyl-CoA hydrolase/transferase family protein [Deltaproteobacteria bacterium]|nr:acetyl-CoA hydrolase/transferase family protein [Deltaproteobacteria bacterium]
MSHFQTPEQAVAAITSNQRVYIQAAAAAPQLLIQAMTDRAHALQNVEVCHLHTEGKAPYADPSLQQSFHVNSFFIGKNVRHTLEAGNGSYTPVFLSELPLLFQRNILPLDVALIQVSPPDKHGYCSLGTTVAASKAAIHAAKHVIAQVNQHMPRTHGSGIIHVSEINTLAEGHQPLPAHTPTPPTLVEQKIGDHIAGLIEDKSTLQMGIGSIPDAVLSRLGNHKHLGIHSEMFSDGVIPLIEQGVIDCHYKGVNPGRALATFLVGSQRLYDFVDDNPFIEMREADYVNAVAIIAQNPNMVAINSAIEVDVTGQVCADSIGMHMYSGVGGQIDFIRGAALSAGGKAIIAMPSTTRSGRSKIVPFLQQGAGVVTTRSHVHYVVTEYGVANLFGKTIKQRVQALVNIAHPDFREEIMRSYYDQHAKQKSA